MPNPVEEKSERLEVFACSDPLVVFEAEPITPFAPGEEPRAEDPESDVDQSES